MADLEDFFAKRDKKKKKAPKFEADSVAKILEKKREDLSKSHTYQPTLSENAEPVSDYKAKEDDDEWRETVEQKPDYSGLKIQELVLEDEEEEEKEGIVEENGQREGPWRLRQVTKADPSVTHVSEPLPEPTLTSTEPTSEPDTEESVGIDDSKSEKLTESGSKVEEVEPVKKAYVPPAVRKAMEAQAAAAAAAAKTLPALATATTAKILPATVSSETKPASTAPVGKYVPVHLRNAGGTPSSTSGHRPRKAVAVPNINDKEFPSLGS